MKKLFKEISYINLLSHQNKKLINFYRDIIGIEPMNSQDEESKWYGFNTVGPTFAIEPMTNRDGYNFDYNKGNPILIQFKAKDLEELEEMNKHLESKGIKLLKKSVKKSYGTITNFLDPDGNIIEILCEN